MATEPIGGVAAPVTLPGTIPHMPAVARIMSRYDRDKLEAFIAIAIDLADTLDGDPEAEEEPLEDAFVAHDPAFADMVADNEAGAYVEWDSMAACTRRTRTTCQVPGQEDDETTGAEDDWPPEGGNFAQSSAGQHVVGGAGCPISDPDLAVDDGPIDGDCDREREQMLGDVLAPATYSLDYNVFNDKRQFLGFTNMMSTFTGEARSADTGAMHLGGGWSGRPIPDKPGAPV